jgi:hypothetical protein
MYIDADIRAARPERFLGHRVNDSNHKSGTDLTDEPPTDLWLAVDLLKQIPLIDPD